MPNSIYTFLIYMQIYHNVFRKTTCFLFEQRWLLVFIKSLHSCLVSSQFSRQKGLDLKTDQAIPQTPVLPEAGKKTCIKILEKCCLDWKLLVWNSVHAIERYFSMRNPFQTDWSRVLVPLQSKLLIVTRCSGELKLAQSSSERCDRTASDRGRGVVWRVVSHVLR